MLSVVGVMREVSRQEVASFFPVASHCWFHCPMHLLRVRDSRFDRLTPILGTGEASQSLRKLPELVTSPPIIGLALGSRLAQAMEVASADLIQLCCSHQSNNLVPTPPVVWLDGQTLCPPSPLST